MNAPLHPIALQALGPGQEAPLAPGRLLSGHPQPRSWDLYTDPTGQFFCGQWAGEVGEWRVSYAPHEEEFCLLLEGKVQLTAADGHEAVYKLGDAFVIPGGFQGVWRNLTPVRKHYAILLLKGSAS